MISLTEKETLSVAVPPSLLTVTWIVKESAVAEVMVPEPDIDPVINPVGV